MANRQGSSEKSDKLFSWIPKSLQMVTAAMKSRHLLLERKAMTNLDSILKSRQKTSKFCKGLSFNKKQINLKKKKSRDI